MARESMNCKAIVGLLAAYMDKEVTPEEQEQIQAHLAACQRCREELLALAAAQKGLRQAFKEMAAQATPPPESWDRIKQRARIKNKVEEPAPKKLLPALITVPLSIFLLVILVGGLFAGIGGVALPPPEPPSLVSDGSGGAFIIWDETPYNNSNRLSANHMDAGGNYLWGLKGKQLAAGKVSPPEAISDGAGGIVVAWRDGNSLHVERLDSTGSSAWMWEEANPPLSLQGMTGDGSGGAVLLWQDEKSQVYAQRVSADGTLLWEAGGIPIIEAAYRGVPMVSDGEGGAVFIWEDSIGENMRIYAQRISHDGELVWAKGGVSVTTIISEKERPRLINDGTGSFIIAWTDMSIATGWDEDIYAQKLDISGNPLWGEQGILVSDAPGWQSNPQIAADGSGGCIIAWPETQYINIKTSGIFAQRINSSGETQWQEGGVLVSNIPQDSPIPNLGLIYIAGDSTGGSTVIWVADKDPASQWARQVYAQKLDANGQRLWSEGGVEVYKNPPFRTIGYSSVISDGSSGFIIGSRVSEGSNMSRTDSVYIQRIDSAGNRLWGESGVEIQMKHSSPILLIIAAMVILITVLVLFGVFRGNRLARIFTAIAPVFIGIAALFSNLLLIGPFGYRAYILDTPADFLSVSVIPIAGLAIGAVGIWKRTVTRWVIIPVVVFCALITFIVEFIIISGFF